MDLAKDSTEDILKAFSTYIETPGTKYAIMIDGDWGCGKTHFWKTILHPIVGKSEAIYISLFGLKTIKDIENELFKTISIVGTDNQGLLKGLLNSNPDIAEDVRFGGLGFAVQFGLNKWKEAKIKKSKNLFLCFDDLERWNGEIEICLSYINKLVEHYGAKCLVIGNSKTIKGKNRKKFQETKEKTIRFKYKLSYSPSIVFQAAVDLVTFPSTESEEYVKNLISENKVRLFEFLSVAKCLNIRTVSISIHYLSIIYLENRDTFDSSPGNAISYFISLLSTLILVEHHKNTDKDREVILDPSLDNRHGRREKLGMRYYEDDGTRKKLSDEEKILNHLFQNSFYHGDEIKLQGRFSIIKYGFYRVSDFEDEFKDWKKTEAHEYYLDTFKSWSLDDENFQILFQKTYDTMFEEEKITNPNTLLLLSDRLTCDIKRGVIDLDFDETKLKIMKLFDDLYEGKRMEHTRISNLRWWNDSLQYCEDIYKAIIKQNEKYNENYEYVDLSKFWIKLKESPDSLDELFSNYQQFNIFALYEEPGDIVTVIESLHNDKLFELTRWMGSRIQDAHCRKAIEEEYERAQVIAGLFEKKYNNPDGHPKSPTCGHFKIPHLSTPRISCNC